MKRVWTRLVCGTLTVVAWGLAAPPIWANGSEKMLAEARPLAAVLRIAPPGVLIPKIDELGRKLQSQGLFPQWESFAGNLGEMAGDPDFASFASDENIGVVFLDGGLPVLILKLDEESPVKKTLVELGFLLRETGGWTLAAREEADGIVLEDASSWIEVVRRPRNHDFEWTGIPSAFSDSAWMDGAGQPAPAAVAEIYQGEMETVKEVLMGFDLEPEAISQIFRIQTRGGSPLAGLFSTDSEKTPDHARFLDDSGTLSLALAIDPKVAGEYLSPLFDRLAAAEEMEDNQVYWRDLQRLVDSFLAKSDGTLAGSFSMEDGMVPGMRMTARAAFTLDEFLPFLELLTEVMARSEAAKTAKYRLLPGRAVVEWVPIHVLRMEDGLETLDLHWALVNGLVVVTSGAGETAAMVRRVLAGESAANPLDAGLSLNKGDWGVLRMDPIGELAALFPNGTEPEPVSGVEPLTMRFRGVDGAFHLRTTFPIKTIARLFGMTGLFSEESP